MSSGVANIHDSSSRKKREGKDRDLKVSFGEGT
jgi:hypothetical protein